MQIAGINNLNFNGRTKFLSCDASGNYKKIAEYQYGSRYFGETKGLRDFILKHSYPFAGVEETIGKDHNNATYKVYIADPKENVSKSIKISHDYIVYDLEPSFPDVRRKYYSLQSGNFDKEFQTLLDYYTRLENTASKAKDEELAKSKQALVYNCKEILSEGAALRAERKDLVSRISYKTNMIDIIKSNVEEYSQKLNVKKNSILTYKRSLDARENKLSNLLKKQEALRYQPFAKPELVDDVNKKIKYLTEAKEAASIRVANYESKILFWENYIKDAPSKIAKCYQDISQYRIRLKEIKKELKPNYEKLCKFYTLNGIKIIKRV